MHPRYHAQHRPDHPALIMAETGERRSYQQLENSANQGAHLLRALGMQRGDVMAVLMDNEAAYFDIAWAAQRCGLYLTSISTKISAGDIAYILQDSGAKLLVTSDVHAHIAAQALRDCTGVMPFTISADLPNFKSWTQLTSTLPTHPIADESAGTDMLYSSGTTGRPKGVKPPLPDGPVQDQVALETMGSALYQMGPDSVYLSTSPLYHAAPLRWAMTVQRLGGTVVVMQKFDAEQSLAHIQNYHITHATWVPTHFVRLLRLPDAVRKSYDHSALVAVIHAAAPCPIPVKHAMIAWWGPIVHEYYSGTEQCGITALSSQEWLEKQGSVGKPVMGSVHIVGPDGQDLPPNEIGDVYFADGPQFSYHNDPAKTAAAHNSQGWATLGDIGYLDDDGFLFLTDRKNFMVISGGVNIYPQEIENFLIGHPSVGDVAVIGLPDPELGEKLVAILEMEQHAARQAADEQPDTAHLSATLKAYVRAGLGSIKTPKEFLFVDQLPREPTGKLMKAKLIQDYRNKI